MSRRLPSFDLYLVPHESRPPTTADRESFDAALRACGRLIGERDDPTRWTWVDRDSSVYFGLVLDIDWAPRRHPALEDVDDDVEPEHRGVLPEESDLAASEEVDEDEDEDEDEDGGEPHEEIAHPPAVISVPLFHPTFVARRAFEFALDLAAAGGLSLVDPHDEDDAGGASRDERLESLHASWTRAHGPVVRELGEAMRCTRWSAEKSAAFDSWGRALRALREETPELDAPIVQPARHEGEIKTLCVWRTDRPARLPETDLVLLERARERRGLLRRRTVIDEILVPGPALRALLGRYSEARAAPAPHLVVRSADTPPSGLVTALEEIQAQAVTGAARTELAGVIDFDLETD